MTFSAHEVRKMIVGLDYEVPLLKGTKRKYVNLDNAATTPPFREVVNSINEFIGWYSSVHRGSGFKSLLSTHLYNTFREIVAAFVSADLSYHTVIFCGNTTDAINRLSRHLRLKDDEIVLTTMMEHHSNLLPWRLIGKVDYTKVNSEDGSLDIEDMEKKLNEHKGKVKLVAVTGASNITGFMPPLKKIAKLAHKYGAYLLVDAAQLIAHRPVIMGRADDPEHIDFLVFSAHKMYAPFGSGVLIGPREFFEQSQPGLVGGGTAKLVTMKSVEWADVPEKEEAGTPNLVGALALAKSIQILQSIGMENITQHERELTIGVMERLDRIPGIKIYGGQNHSLKQDRVSVVPIIAEKIPHALLAAVLSYEWGIGVRHGCFCAHPYLACLLDLNENDMAGYLKMIRAGDRSKLPGFVRISMALYNTEEDIEYLAEALEDIISRGPQGRYYVDKYTGEYFPENYSCDLNSYFSL